ncbi:glycosyltransferase involved in cell wall biosynthesis [Geodermatophilus bullaregiensis]|uniref:glycosyltransferase family 4 protein n=1 Tax=Geodermatophilus bullaregiensis TaxID=1564160 RepID=UPI00195CA165|nr:glycosyltransferase family 4 protein [Geodermatophilus bullaregiensis]MBM7807024.1 glycosyltransferase involved in cell wall biosynthesis [Geodermatophilus bullaregiensis]
MAKRPHPTPQPLIVVRADTRDVTLHTGAAEAEERRRPDFFALRDALQGRIIDENDVQASRWGRLVRAVAGTYVALAVVAFGQRRSATAFVTGSENEAIVLAFLLKLARTRIPLVLPAIYPAKPAKWPAWRWARVHRYMSRVLALGTVQADRLVNGLGVPRDKVEVLPYGIDTRYWSPQRATPHAATRPYVFAAGLQHRDYWTLIEATEGLGVDLVVAASSLWSKSRNELADAPLPSWVQVRSLRYGELRDAYAGAAVVACPLVETDFPAGTTSIVEAMAMGRPVVLTRAEGTGDYVVDRRRALRRGPLRSTSAGHATRFAAESHQEQTGFLVAPGDAEALRSILQWVLTHPEDAEAVGARARAVAEEVYSLEAYVGRIVAAVQEAMAEAAGRRVPATAEPVPGVSGPAAADVRPVHLAGAARADRGEG